MAFKIGKGVVRVPFNEVLTSSVWELVIELCELGALVSFGGSRDGGALAITVTCSGEWDREWFRSEEEALTWMQDAVRVVGELTPSPSTGSRRTRGR